MDDIIGTCEICGKTNEEIKPYGPNQELICYECSLMNPDLTYKMMMKRLSDLEEQNAKHE